MRAPAIAIGVVVFSLLAGCASGRSDDAIEADGRPSPQVRAFMRVDERLGYRNAQIEYDRGCAVYRGVAPDGDYRSEPLLDEEGRPICHAGSDINGGSGASR